MLHIPLPSLNETRDFAARLSQLVDIPQFISLNGTLGAGKTQFVRFFAEGLGVAPENVTSPTYVLLQRYGGKHRIYHFDFYRLRAAEEVWDLGFDEILEERAIVVVEWADKFPQCMPFDYLEIELQIDSLSGEECRVAVVTAFGPRSKTLIDKI
jgi:tRNA threonylcarbamoyladenosine biosynthesis protein TsaE